MSIGSSPRRSPRAILAATLGVPVALCAASAQELELTGRVVDELQAPIAGAAVELYEMPTRYAARLRHFDGSSLQPVQSVRTDRDGRYRLEVPRVDLWDVVVRREGYLTMDTHLRPLFASRRLNDFTLVRGEELEVNVTDDTGSPVAGARVYIGAQRASRELDDSMAHARWQWGLTSHEGRIVFGALGFRSTLYVAADGFLPGTLRPREGDTRVRVRLRRGRPVSVRILDDEDRPVAGALVFGDMPEALTDRDGVATVVGDPNALRTLFVADERRRTTRLEVGGRRAQLTARLGPPTTLQGTVQGPDGEGVEGAWIWVGSSYKRVVRSDARGRFQIDATLPLDAATRRDPSPLADETFIVTAAHPEMAHGWISMSYADALRNEAVQIELHELLRLTGRVQSSQELPIENARVRLERVTSGSNFIVRTATTGADGSFDLVARERDGPLRLRTKAEGYARSVIPLGASSGTHEVQVTLRKGHLATGRVVDASERPIAGAHVVLSETRTIDRSFRRMQDTGETFQATTDREGGFVLRGVSGGNYSLEVSAAGFAAAKIPGLELEGLSGDAAETFLGTVALEQGVSVTGNVVDADGNGIGGVSVSVGEEAPAFGRLGEEEPPEAVTGASGGFEISDLREGSKVVLTFKADGFSTTRVGPIEMPPLEPLEVRLEESWAVAGTVSDEEGRPVSRVYFMARPENLLGAREFPNAQSDDLGSFRLEGLGRGRWIVSLRHNEFATADPVTLDIEDADILDLELVLERGEKLVGRVTDEEGRGVDGVHIRVEERRAPFQFSSPPYAISMHSGRYELSGLEVGELAIVASHDEYAETRVALEIAAGVNERDIELQSGFQITGTVVDERGAPVPGTELRLEHKSGFNVRRSSKATSDGAGAFELEGLSAGTYSLVADAKGFAVHRSDDFEVRGDVTGHQIELERGVVLRGQIQGVGVDELSTVSVIVNTRDSRPVITTPDFEGRFELSGLTEGAWRVVASLGAGGRSVVETLEIERGELEAFVELTFEDGATITGTVVRDGQPVGGRFLSMTPTSGDPSQGRYGQVDSTGRFLLEDVAPGEYTLRVHSSTGTTGHEETIYLAGDEDLTIDLRTQSLEGVVVTSDGQPTAAQLSIRPLAGNDESTSWGMAQIPTGADGSFALREVLPGSYRLLASAEGHADGFVEVEIREGEDLKVIVVQLEESAGLSLRVFDPNGLPVHYVMAVLLDQAGGQVSSHSGPVTDGRLDLDSAPRGDWTLLVSDGQSPTMKLPVSVPGVELLVQLAPGGAVSVRATDAPPIGSFQLIGSDGEAYRSGVFGPQARWPIVGGLGHVDAVPAGQWTLEATFESGTVRQLIEVAAGAALEVVVTVP